MELLGAEHLFRATSECQPLVTRTIQREDGERTIGAKFESWRREGT